MWRITSSLFPYFSPVPPAPDQSLPSPPITPPPLTYSVATQTTNQAAVITDNSNEDQSSPREFVNITPHRPLTLQDIERFKENIPSFEDEPFVVIRNFEIIYIFYNPTWSEVEDLMHALLTEEERNKVLSLVNEAQGFRAVHWPTEDPKWDPNLEEDYLSLCHARDALLEAMRDCSYRPHLWTKFENMKQEENENPMDFMDRLVKLGRRSLGLDLSREKDLGLLRRQFVRNCCTVVKNYFMTDCPKWTVMDISELKIVADYIFNRPEDKEEKLDILRKEIHTLTEELKKVIAKQGEIISLVKKSTKQPLMCYFCGKKGHIAINCRKRNPENGNRSLRNNNNRSSYRIGDCNRGNYNPHQSIQYGVCPHCPHCGNPPQNGGTPEGPGGEGICKK
ncbi:uncharacterized protein LOC107651026 [Monodelphis domestica]|uniref:Uncharacterized LOC107651026 n=1 Tax=Monodelphis domestica TaxID=13616 RepID=K7E1R5_MONDO|nr:uncharacterized protein LOC107651026 [Monodelphis domestica]